MGSDKGGRTAKGEVLAKGGRIAEGRRPVFLPNFFFLILPRLRLFQ